MIKSLYHHASHLLFQMALYTDALQKRLKQCFVIYSLTSTANLSYELLLKTYRQLFLPQYTPHI